MSAQNSPLYRASLTVTPAQVRSGHATTLCWSVAGVDVALASIHLSSGDESGMCVIESAPTRGARQMIFSRPGVFTFTLTATFADGVRRSRQVRVSVTP